MMRDDSTEPGFFRLQELQDVDIAADDKELIAFCMSTCHHRAHAAGDDPESNGPVLHLPGNVANAADDGTEKDHEKLVDAEDVALDKDRKDQGKQQDAAERTAVVAPKRRARNKCPVDELGVPFAAHDSSKLPLHLPCLSRLPRTTYNTFGKPRGLSAETVLRCLLLGIPISILNALLRVMQHMPEGDYQSVHCAELFSGVANVAGEFRAKGYKARLYDENGSSFEDISTPAGMATCLSFLLQQSPSSVSHYATVCSSWMFISRSTTRRGHTGFWNDGDQQVRAVREGNQLASRTAICIALGYALLLQFILEQPGSSVICASKWMIKLRQMLPWVTTHTWMGRFGKPTAKPTELYSTSLWTQQLARKKSKVFDDEFNSSKAVDTATDDVPNSSGGCLKRRKVTVNAGLKETQEYPVGYGRAVVSAWEKGALPDYRIEVMGYNRIMDRLDPDASIDWNLWMANAQPPHWWEEAGLSEPCDFLEVHFHMPM